MSKYVLWTAATLLVAGLILAGFRENKQMTLVKEGAPAPAFDLEKLDGSRVKLADLKGKLVMVDFWATWCPPCNEEIPYLTQIAREHAKDPNFAFVAISADDMDSKADVPGFAAKLPDWKPYVAYETDEVHLAYNIEALPTLYFIGPDGKILEGHRGLASEEWIRKRISEYLPR